MAKRAAKSQKSLFDSPDPEVPLEDEHWVANAGPITTESPSLETMKSVAGHSLECLSSQVSPRPWRKRGRLCPQALAATGYKPILQPRETPSPPPASLAGQTVWVVDAHSLIHQVFHAIPDMTSPSGQPVNAVYGFTRDLFYLLESKQPDFLFCAFDLPGKTFRHALYEQYKAGRPDMHEDLVPQIDFVHRMVEALGIPLLAHEGFEADDIVATVARIDRRTGRAVFHRQRRQGLPATDHRTREALQHPQERGHRPRGPAAGMGRGAEPGGRLSGPGRRFDRQRARRALDRAQGGPRPAGKIRHAWRTFSTHVDEVSGAAKKENLKKYREQALLSRKLVKLDAHVPLAISWKSARPDGGDHARALRAVRGIRLPPPCRAAAARSATRCAQGRTASSAEQAGLHRRSTRPRRSRPW